MSLLYRNLDHPGYPISHLNYGKKKSDTHTRMITYLYKYTCTSYLYEYL
jgi:hypothetical protein